MTHVQKFLGGSTRFQKNLYKVLNDSTNVTRRGSNVQNRRKPILTYVTPRCANVQNTFSAVSNIATSGGHMRGMIQNIVQIILKPSTTP